MRFKHVFCFLIWGSWGLGVYGQSHTITDIKPHQRAADQIMIIFGTNFSPTASENIIIFTGQTGAFIRVPAHEVNDDQTELKVKIPPTAASGAIRLEIGGIAISLSIDPPKIFTLIEHSIIDFSPKIARVGDLVVLEGFWFLNAPLDRNEVQLGGLLTGLGEMATVLRVFDDRKKLEFRVPNRASIGRQPISLKIGSIVVNSHELIEILPPLSLSGFSPTTIYPGEVLTITGLGFAKDPSHGERNYVLFGDPPSHALEAHSVNAPGTELKVRIPFSAAGTSSPIEVSIRSHAGTEQVKASSTASLRILPPAVSSIAPPRGRIGTRIVFTGRGFSPETSPSVEFQGSGAASVTIQDGNHFHVTVPPSTTPGAIRVSFSGRYASTHDFIVLPPPVLSDFNPKRGIPTDEIVLTGQDFSATASDHIVGFGGGVSARASGVNTARTELRVEVPTGAVTGPITLSLDDGLGVAATSTSSFVVPDLYITDINPASARIGEVVVITGHGFSLDPDDNFIDIQTGETANPFEVNADGTQIKYRVALGHAFPFIRISSHRGGATHVYQKDGFSIIPPRLLSFSPTRFSFGDELVLIGTGFAAVASYNQVAFLPLRSNGIARAFRVNADGTELRIRVPQLRADTPPYVPSQHRLRLSFSSFLSSPTTEGTFVPLSLSSFSPQSGRIGTPIRFTGTGFSPIPEENVLVLSSGVEAVGVELNPERTQLVIKIPSYAGNSSHSVLYTRDRDNQVPVPGTLEILFPRLISFFPSTAYAGEIMQIRGRNFSPIAEENKILFRFPGGRQLAVPCYEVGEAGSLLFLRIPPVFGFSSDRPLSRIGVQVGDLEIFTPDPSFQFTHYLSQVDDFSPQRARVGEEIVIRGSHFSSIPSDHILNFKGGASASEGKVAAHSVSADRTELRVRVSRYAHTRDASADLRKLQIGSPYEDQVQTLPSPFERIHHTVSDFSPTAQARGGLLSLRGSDFSVLPEDNEVIFSGDEKTVIRASQVNAEGTEIKARLPEEVTGERLGLSVRIGNLVEAVSDDLGIASVRIIRFLGEKIVSENDPSRSYPGATFFFEGLGIPEAFQLVFRSRDGKIRRAEGKRYVNPSRGLVTIPYFPEGTYEVSVHIEFQEGEQTMNSPPAEDMLTIVQDEIPPIGISPTSGRAGDLISFSGRALNLLSLALEEEHVFFGGNTEAPPYEYVHQVRVPQGARTGIVQIRFQVINSSSGQPVNISLSSQGNFTILPQRDLSISSFSPSTLRIGDILNVEGSGFSQDPSQNKILFGIGNTRVTFNRAFWVNAAGTQLKVYVPLSSLTGKIQAQVLDRHDPELLSNSSSGILNITSLGTLTFTGFDPYSGRIGDVIRIQGTGLITRTWIGFSRADDADGNPRTPIWVESFEVNAAGTEIQVRIPPEAITGKLSLRISSLASRAADANILESNTSFTILTGDANGGTGIYLGSFSPVQARVGETITIYGTGLSAMLPPAKNRQSGVFFEGGAYLVEVDEVSDDGYWLRVRVPGFAGTGPLGLRAPEGSSFTSSSSFTRLEHTVSDFSPKGPLSEQDVLVIEGTNFAADLIYNELFGGHSTLHAFEVNRDGTELKFRGLRDPSFRAVLIGNVSVSLPAKIQVLAPEVTDFYPKEVLWGQSISLKGTHLKTRVKVYFPSAAAAASGHVSRDGELVEGIRIPTGAITGNIAVEFEGFPRIELEEEIRILVPQVIDFSTHQARVGEVILVRGRNFSLFPEWHNFSFGRNNALARSFEVNENRTQVKIRVPPLAQNGNIGIGDMLPHIDLDPRFERLNHSISGFKPRRGSYGQEFIITGRNFSGLARDNIIIFAADLPSAAGGRAWSTAAYYVNEEGTEIRARVPGRYAVEESELHIPPEGKLAVRIGEIEELSQDVFGVDRFVHPHQLIITHLSPNLFEYDDILIVEGRGFSSRLTENLISLSTEGPVFHPLEVNLQGTRLKIRVPAHTPQDPILRIDSHGQHVIYVDLRYRKISVGRFIPLEAKVGETIRLRGSLFSAKASDHIISFGEAETRATSVNRQRSELEIVVPTGAADGKIRVNIGALSLLTPESFVLRTDEDEDEDREPSTREPDSRSVLQAAEALTIQSFVPQFAFVGDTIYIRGKGFSDNPKENRVFFGTEEFFSTPLGIEKDGRIGKIMEVLVPAGGQTGRIIIKLDRQTVWSLVEFKVLEPEEPEEERPTYDPIFKRDFQDPQVQLSPNPAHLNLRVSHRLPRGLRYRILDLQGQNFRIGHLHQSPQIISLRDMPAGVYIFQVLDIRKSYKFVKR
ncbi:MAG: IPT/TIG domain-containing protein [Cytophagales bacterium]|nr:IPT/TIG domain-containing protein [Cytophagales bacterium]